MSLEVIEMMIKESLRDGEISASERETLVKQGESFGISKETVFSMIDAEVEKLNSKIKEEKKKQQEADAKKELEKVKRENEAKKLKVEEAKKEKQYEYKGNFQEWKYDFDEVNFLTWGLLYGGIGLVVGIINAYSHSKGWGAYIGMPLLGLVYGYMAYGIAIGISFIAKRKPLLDWHKPVLIVYSVLVLAFICYLVIPF